MNDRDIREAVEQALDWEPMIDGKAIGVSVDDAVVTLTGHVATYAEKREAEKVSGAVRGVRAVVCELKVILPTQHERTDEDIARAIVHALEWDVAVPNDRIKVHVEQGWVILKGTVDYKYHQIAAENAIRNLAGVTGITNHIKFNPTATPSEVKAKIEGALRRGAESEAKKIQVEVSGHRVVLTGKVHNWRERRDAERAAWSAPGVAEVDDHLVIV